MKKVGSAYVKNGVNYLLVDNKLIREFKFKGDDAYYRHNGVVHSLGASNNTVDVSCVTNMSCMFDEARLFNGDISNWDVSGVTDMRWMFNNKTFTDINNHNIPEWYTDKHKISLGFELQGLVLPQIRHLPSVDQKNIFRLISLGLEVFRYKGVLVDTKKRFC